MLWLSTNRMLGILDGNHGCLSNQLPEILVDPPPHSNKMGLRKASVRPGT